MISSKTPLIMFSSILASFINNKLVWEIGGPQSRNVWIFMCRVNLYISFRLESRRRKAGRSSIVFTSRNVIKFVVHFALYRNGLPVLSDIMHENIL